MDQIIIQARVRNEQGKQVRKFRRQGLIPAVLYGKKTENKNLWINDKEFRKAYLEAGENTVVQLKIENGDQANVLIYDIQRNPLSGNFSHIDFFKIRMDEKIETEIPLEFVGEAPAVKEKGGTLVKNMNEIAVKCLPADLPSELKVDLARLKTFDDYFKVKDLKVSDKVELILDGETIIALVTPPRSEGEMMELNQKVEEDVTKVEGIEKKEKKEEKEKA